MRRLLLPLGLATAMLCSLPAWAQQPADATPLTLDRALELATTRSLQLISARHDVEATEGVVTQAGVRPNPALSLLTEDPGGSSRTRTGTLDIPLELGNKRNARIAAAERLREVSLAELDQTRASLRSRVALAFASLLLAQERVTLSARAVTIATHMADSAGRRVAAGKTSPVDQLRAEVDVANAKLLQADAAAQQTSARRALAATWNNTEPMNPIAVGDVHAIPTRGSLDGLASQLDAAPSIVLGRIEQRRRRALVDVERSKRWPDVVLTVGARHDVEIGRTQAVVGVSLPLPFFDRNQGAVHEALRREEKAAVGYESTRLQVIGELQDAVARLERANASAAVMRATAVPAAARAHEAASTGFAAGKFALTDVLDAQRTMLTMQGRYLDALADAHEAAALIDRLLGH